MDILASSFSLNVMQAYMGYITFLLPPPFFSWFISMLYDNNLMTDITEITDINWKCRLHTAKLTEQQKPQLTFLSDKSKEVWQTRR